MNIFEIINRKSDQFAYIWGALVAKKLLREFGKKSLIHRSAKYILPSKIIMGSGCEIRHHCFFDARSSHNISIQIGNGTRIKDNVSLLAYGGSISIGNKVLIGRLSTLFGHGELEIGNNSMLGPNTTIMPVEHVFYIGKESFQDQGFIRKKISIGDNVYIGANTSIIAGSTIPDDVAIGAGSVVKGELESGWLYAGIPARPIKLIGHNKPEGVEIHKRDWGLFE